MPYYGDPESIRTMNKNITSLESAATFEQQVAAWSAIVTPVLEGHLRAVFSSWPDPDDTNQNAISTLWILSMTMFIQTGKFATNTPGSQSAYGGTSGDLYGQLLRDMESGRLVIDGAFRVSMPSVTPGARPRWKVSDINQPDTPQGVADTFPKGLRV